MGSINTHSGYGQALLEIKGIGEKETVSLLVYLEKEPVGEWQLMETQIR